VGDADPDGGQWQICTSGRGDYDRRGNGRNRKRNGNELEAHQNSAGDNRRAGRDRKNNAGRRRNRRPRDGNRDDRRRQDQGNMYMNNENSVGQDYLKKPEEKRARGGRHRYRREGQYQRGVPSHYRDSYNQDPGSHRTRRDSGYANGYYYRANATNGGGGYHGGKYSTYEYDDYEDPPPRRLGFNFASDFK
ncbi:unnamed protein product, partial [Gongylonema pulchrum]|uniref:Eukaryotic translation initiation factor 3 subunit A n=1 Tax=Gongylonema pulchrum TaxID=637853 RepID=A0A183DGL8_9BILA